MAMFRREQKSSVEPEPAINAEELRKRLLGARALDVNDESKRLLEPEAVSAAPEPQPEPKQNGHGATASKPPSRAADDSVKANNLSPSDPEARTNAPDGGNPMSPTDLPAGPAEVAKMFEPIRVFQERLSKMGPAFDQVDKLGKGATSALESVAELAEHLSQFAGAYAPVKAFHNEVTVLAEKFDPLKSIKNQLAEMSRSFRDHLNYLVAVMEPASKIQERLAELAQAFEPANELKERFQQLASEFEVLSNPASSGPTVNGQAGNAQGGVAR